MDDTTRICAAVASPQPLDTRFVGVLPLELGGWIAVVGGTDRAGLARALAKSGIETAALTHCPESGLVLYLSGVNAGFQVENIQRAVTAEIPTVVFKETDIVPPRLPAGRPRIGED